MENTFAETFSGGLDRPPDDVGGPTSLSAAVVCVSIGVGHGEDYEVGVHGQLFCGDLAHTKCDRTGPDLGRTGDQAERAVRLQAEGHSTRHRIRQPDGSSDPDPPVGTAPERCPRCDLFDGFECGPEKVGVLEYLSVEHGVPGIDSVADSEFAAVHSDRIGQIVRVAFEGEVQVGARYAAKRPSRGSVRVDGPSHHPGVLNGVRTIGDVDRNARQVDGVARVRARVHVDGVFTSDDSSITCHARTDADDGVLAGVAGEEILDAIVDHLDRATGDPGEERGVRFQADIQFRSEPAPHYPHPNRLARIGRPGPARLDQLAPSRQQGSRSRHLQK